MRRNLFWFVVPLHPSDRLYLPPPRQLLDDLPGYLSPSVNGSDLLQKIRESISDIVQ
jgi:hypothetical protein